jgi:hypothetical protein
MAAAPSAFAQGQEVFEWNGRVDREVQLSVRGNQVAMRDLRNGETGRERSRVMMQLPRQDGQLFVRLLNGRGSAQVIQQPSSRNNYTATIRIQDPSNGADDYRVAGYWQRNANGDVYGRNRNDRDNHDYDRDGRGRDRDDRGYPERDRNGVGNGQYNNQSMLHWSGNVDGELEIRVQNGRVDYRTLSGAQPTSVRADRGNSAARNAGRVAVAQNQGRGSVTVLQQPASNNGYTTVIRVRDPQGGYGFYDFNLITQ